MRVAVTFQGDALDPGAWSGTPLGVVRGLAALGVDVETVRAAPDARYDRRLQQLLALPRLRPSDLAELGPRGALGEAKGAARISVAYSRLCSVAARRGLRALDPVDAVVQVGTGYRVEHPRAVTYEDMTIAQVLGHPYFSWERLSAHEVERRRTLQRAAYDDAVGCATATPWAAASIVEEYAISAHKVAAVGVGRNHELSAPADRDWSRPRFLFVGKDWEDKNGPQLLAAFAKVREHHVDATLDLVGHHPAVSQPGVTGHGFLRRDDPVAGARMADIFARATCLVVPTTFEPAGIVYVEAAAAGLPVVGTSLGGAADLIGQGGVAVDPRDVDAIAAAMSRLTDPELARSVGQAARARAELFTWPRVARRLVQLLGLEDRDPADWDGLFVPAPAGV